MSPTCNLRVTTLCAQVLISAVFFREFLPWQIYASLVPIIGGVGLASLKEVSFSWLSFVAGTGSAVTSASKAILSKKVRPRVEPTVYNHHAQPRNHHVTLCRRCSTASRSART